MPDTKRTVTCPACDKEMTKVFIKEANINVDICLDGCGGILFDNRELERFDEKHENADEIFEAIKEKTFEPANEVEVRICTICDTPMVKQGSGIEGVEIDVCNNCGAKFLDNGELKKIREYTKKSEYQNKIDAQISNAESENEYIPGGKVGNFAKNHLKSTGIRNVVEYIVGKIIK